MYLSYHTTHRETKKQSPNTGARANDTLQLTPQKLSVEPRNSASAEALALFFIFIGRAEFGL